MTATKKEVTLQFPSFYTMWTYIRAARLQFYELDYLSCIMNGACTKEEIALVVNKSGAKVISKTFSNRTALR